MSEIIPNIRRCMFVIGLNDPQARSVTLAGVVMASKGRQTSITSYPKLAIFLK